MWHPEVSSSDPNTNQFDCDGSLLCLSMAGSLVIFILLCNDAQFGFILPHPLKSGDPLITHRAAILEYDFRDIYGSVEFTSWNADIRGHFWWCSQMAQASEIWGNTGELLASTTTKKCCSLNGRKWNRNPIVVLSWQIPSSSLSHLAHVLQLVFAHFFPFLDHDLHRDWLPSPFPHLVNTQHASCII